MQSAGDNGPAPVPDTARVIRFEAAEIAAIKAAATAPAAAKDQWVSTFEALSAHLHQCVWNARFGSGASAEV